MIGAGATVVASLLLSSVIAGLADRFGAQVLLRVAERIGSLAILTVLFAALYHTLPDAPVRWGDVWLGAGVAAVLTTLGTWGLGWYLGYASVTSAYGAAGALAAFLLWIYYSAQIFFLGAELTTVYAERTTATEVAPASLPAPEPPSAPAAANRPSSWLRRLGWIGLGVVLARLFRR